MFKHPSFTQIFYSLIMISRGLVRFKPSPFFFQDYFIGGTMYLLFASHQEAHYVHWFYYVRKAMIDLYV